MAVITAVSATSPGNSRLGKAAPGVAGAAEHLAENEEQEERLEDDLGEKGRKTHAR